MENGLDLTPILPASSLYEVRSRISTRFEVGICRALSIYGHRPRHRFGVFKKSALARPSHPSLHGSPLSPMLHSDSSAFRWHP